MQSLASKAAAERFEKQVEEAKQKDQELDKKLQEAEHAVERARKWMAAPKDAVGTASAKGCP